MANIVIIVVVAAMLVFGVRSYVKKLAKGGCCGGSGSSSVKKIKVQDRDKSHYPYQCRMHVDGMSCGNCAARVENALNSLEGVWAKVDLDKKEATVLMKQNCDDQMLKEAVRGAGYAASNIQRQ